MAGKSNGIRTTKTALKKLMFAMTGKKSTSQSVSKVIEDIADNFKMPTNPLPTVTAADNGKVAKVVNGAWDKGTETVELPAFDAAADKGKILAIKTDGSGLEWIAKE